MRKPSARMGNELPRADPTPGRSIFPVAVDVQDGSAGGSQFLAGRGMMDVAERMTSR
jgi:hypothetical protein